jgi:drug/metabolite transporter (DMT)-like permease
VRSAGLALAVVGIVLASREDDAGPADARQRRLSIVLAIVAGLGFGSYFVLAEIGSSGDVAWALVLSRTAAFPIIATIALVVLRRGATRPPGLAVATLAGIGLLDLGANFLFNYASTIGELSSVAVASSLYPVTTVMLAAWLLGERVQGVQRAGVVIALAGVVMIAAGS